MKALILYYSLYNHVFELAKAMAEGVREVPGADAILRKVPETLPTALIEKIGGSAGLKAQESVAVATHADLESADALIIGAPTRFGNMVSQMAAFLDSTGPLWAKGALVGKVGSAFTSSATQHGGNETTLHAIHHFLLHQGLVVVGLPYAFTGQTRLDEVTGGSPYGTTTIAGGDGSRKPSDNERAAARFQGSHVARITLKLAKG